MYAATQDFHRYVRLGRVKQFAGEPVHRGRFTFSYLPIANDRRNSLCDCFHLFYRVAVSVADTAHLRLIPVRHLDVVLTYWRSSPRIRIHVTSSRRSDRVFRSRGIDHLAGLITRWTWVNASRLLASIGRFTCAVKHAGDTTRSIANDSAISGDWLMAVDTIEHLWIHWIMLSVRD